MQYIGSLEAAEKHISAKIFLKNLHTSVKILQICMDLQDSVQRSLQNPAEKIMQICTDLQRSKTWDVELTDLRVIFNSMLNGIKSRCLESQGVRVKMWFLLSFFGTFRVGYETRIHSCWQPRVTHRWPQHLPSQPTGGNRGGHGTFCGGQGWTTGGHRWWKSSCCIQNIAKIVY